MEGTTDAEKLENFCKTFSCPGVFKDLNLPKVNSAGNLDNNGGIVCMNFQLTKCLHEFSTQAQILEAKVQPFSW